MQAEINQNSGRFSFKDNGHMPVAIEHAAAWLRYDLHSGQAQQAFFTGVGSSSDEIEIEDVHGPGTQQVVQCAPNPNGIQLIYRISHYDQYDFILLCLTVRNLGREPVYLQEICLCQAGPSVGAQINLAAAGDGLRFFKVGWLGWDHTSLKYHYQRNSGSWIDRLTSSLYSNPATAKPKARGNFSSEGWGMLAGRDVCIVSGLLSTAHQFGQVYACTRPGETALSLVTQLDGIRLDPGETCDSEWGYLQFVQLPSAQPEADFVDAVSRQMGGRVPSSPPPPMWTHWYQYYHNITEQVFIQNLEVLADRREIIPYQVVELDDGYQSAWGDWTLTNANFPHGLKWLAEHITARGFKPGLWLAPFAVERKSILARDHPDWLVNDRKGKPAKTGFVYNMFIQALDLTHPGVLEHLRALAHTLTNEWGYKMLKIDFINAASLPGVRSNPKQTRAEALRAGLEAIRQGAGEDTFLLGCGCPFGPAIGVVDAMRIGPDTAPSWEPYFNWLPWVSPFTKKNPSMPALRNALRHTLNLSSLHQRWWWNDPDCLLARDIYIRGKGLPDLPHLTEAEVQSAISLVGLSGGMLVSSDDLQQVSPERMHWVSRLVPNLGLRGAPLDLLEHEMPSVYRVAQEAVGQLWQLVALFNWSDQPVDGSLRFHELGYSTGTRLQVFDYWQGSITRTDASEVVFHNIPPHGCKLLRVCEVSNQPQLVGDTLHISMGAELESLRIADEKMFIKTISMGRRVEGELWMRLDRMPDQVLCNGAPVVVKTAGDGVYVIPLQFVDVERIEIGF